MFDISYASTQMAIKGMDTAVMRCCSLKDRITLRGNGIPRKSANSGKMNLTKPPLCKQNSKPELDEPKSEDIKDIGQFPSFTLDRSHCTMGINNNSSFETLSSRRTIKAIRRE